MRRVEVGGRSALIPVRRDALAQMSSISQPGPSSKRSSMSTVVISMAAWMG